MNTQEKIAAECDAIKEMLLEKNRKYGDSALNLDDKLSRLRSRQADEDEDVIADLIGYLVLLKIASAKQAD